jgi:hypothetical protein
MEQALSYLDRHYIQGVPELMGHFFKGPQLSPQIT